jgi:hypothetical protein
MLDRIRIASLITRLIFSYLHYLLAFDCALIAMSFPSAGLMEHAVILIMLILSYLVRERSAQSNRYNYIPYYNVSCDFFHST